MKKVVSLALAVMLLLSLSAFAFAEEKPVHLKFSVMENEEHPQGLLMAAFKEKVEELSEGNITVDIFYNGSLYSLEAAMQAIRSGELEMTNTSMQVSSEYLASKGLLNMLTSTFVFKDYEHMRKVVDGEIGESLFNQFIEENVGYVPIGFFYNGSRQLNLRTDKEVMKPEDLKSTILRMPSSDAWIAAGESLGAKVTPLAYSEVYTALQNGTIDAQDNPMPAVKTAKFYEVTKQLCMTYHIIDCEIVALNTDTWNSFSDQQKAWVKEAVDYAVKVCDDATIALESDLVAFFENEGLKIVYPDHDAFASYALNYYKEKGLTADWDMDLYQQIQDMAK